MEKILTEQVQSLSALRHYWKVRSMVMVSKLTYTHTHTLKYILIVSHSLNSHLLLYISLIYSFYLLLVYSSMLYLSDFGSYPLCLITHSWICLTCLRGLCVNSKQIVELPNRLLRVTYCSGNALYHSVGWGELLFSVKTLTNRIFCSRLRCWHLHWGADSRAGISSFFLLLFLLISFQC